MATEPNHFDATLKALPIFSTMRSNLAMVDAFLRRSIIETSDYKDEDLGFLGVAPGRDQLEIHNRSVTLIVVALLYQSLENYLDLTRIDPRLEDPSLQDFFKRLGGRRRFLESMKTVRKGVFHVRSTRSWRSRSARFFDEVCGERGGVLPLMSELRMLLYDFTEKVFIGKLRIWPDYFYEEMERMEIARPGLREKLESGEIEFTEYMDAILSPEENAPGSE